MNRQMTNEADRMVVQVMSQTSGSACSRAREVICLRADDRIDAMTEILLANHTAHCSTCRKINAVLPGILTDLKEMRNLEPDVDFAEDVLNATSRNMLPQRGWRWKQVVEVIDRLLFRPRIAWEFAYTMTVIVLLTLRLSGTPIHAIQPAMMPIFDGRVVVRATSGTDEVIKTIEDFINGLKHKTLLSVEKVQNTGRAFKTSLTEKRIEPAMMEVVDLWNSVSHYFRVNPENNDGGQNGTSDKPGV